MNENIDLTKILKDCPKGWKFYSSIIDRDVIFVKLAVNAKYPIVVHTTEGVVLGFTEKGWHYQLISDAECTLFPSKDQRDWSKFIAPWYKKSKFDPKTLQPFDKVLARYNSDDMWKVDFYSHKGVSKTYPYRCIGSPYTYCVPYNDETKHLVGTTKEAPEYYRYWED